MRSMLVCALVLGVAGCNQIFGLEPPGPGGGDDAANTDAGDDAPGVDGGIDGPLPGDLDGDGVLDDMDSCPTAWNPSQADEDGDAEINGGDACDPCPHLGSSGTAHTDTDGDGIGDDCDPRSDTAHCLVWFDGFRDGSAAEILARYTIDGGQWGIDDGRVSQRDTAAPSARLIANTLFAAPRVTSHGDILDLPTVAVPGAFRNLIGVLVQAPIAQNGICLGSISRSVEGGVPTSPPATVFSSQHPPDGEVFVNESTFPLTTPMGAGIAFTIDLDLLNPSLRTTTGILPGAGVQVLGTPPCADGAPGLRTSYAAISFDYLLVFTVRGPAGCPPRGPLGAP